MHAEVRLSRGDVLIRPPRNSLNEEVVGAVSYPWGEYSMPINYRRGSRMKRLSTPAGGLSTISLSCLANF